MYANLGGYMENNDRVLKLKDLLNRLETDEDKDAIQEDFNKHFSSVSTKEIAAAEELLLQQGSTVQDIGELCQLHTAMMNESIEIVHLPETEIPGHPARMLEAENIGLEEYLNNTIKPSLENKTITLENLHKLKRLNSHYDKKDNLLFPFLEKVGITGPSNVMWQNENKVKKELSRIIKLYENSKVLNEQEYKDLNKLVEDIEGMILLERTVLMPMVLEHIKPNDWVLIAEEAIELNYVFLNGTEGSSLSDANTWLLSKKGIQHDLPMPGEIKLPTGSFNLDQLKATLNALELDITILDENDKVLYFNEMKPRYFTRTKTVIGRDVYLCHPPKSIPIVKNILDLLKSRKKTEASFYFPKGDFRLLIRYIGLYDDNQKYIGCLESVQDIKPLEKYFEGTTLEVGERRVDSNEINTEQKEITLKMTLNELLQSYPNAFEVLLELSPTYSKLNNPITRKAMGTFATIEMISERGNFDKDEFVKILKEKLVK